MQLSYCAFLQLWTEQPKGPAAMHRFPTLSDGASEPIKGFENAGGRALDLVAKCDWCPQYTSWYVYSISTFVSDTAFLSRWLLLNLMVAVTLSTRIWQAALNLLPLWRVIDHSVPRTVDLSIFLYSKSNGSPKGLSVAIRSTSLESEALSLSYSFLKLTNVSMGTH